MKRWMQCVGLLMAGSVASLAQGREFQLKVDARTNLFAAGRAAVPDFPGGGGVMPPGISFAAQPGQIITILSASGRVSCIPIEPNLGSEGGHCCGDGSTDIGSYQGISGMKHARRQMFLAGVFLSDSAPVDPAPPVLDCTTWIGAPEVAPGLAQTFYIGDGVAQGGMAQRILVPRNATRLFLGIVDGYDIHASQPGYYNDNRGELNVALRIHGGSASATAATTPPPPPAPPQETPVVHPKLPPPAPVELNAAQKQAFRQFLKRLKGVPAAYVDERPFLQKDRLVLVKADWKRLGPTIMSVLSPEEKEIMNVLMNGLSRVYGLEASRFAVYTYGFLAGKLPVSWERNIRWADRDVLDAWICAEEGRWSSIPNLGSTFTEVLKQGDEEHLKLIPLIRENLQKAQDAIRARDKAKTKLQCALLRKLLEELEIT
jgi:hypothetical protein